MKPSIAVVSLRAEDVEEAADFYRDAIGLPMVEHTGHRPHFKIGGSFLVILQGKPQPELSQEPERFPVLALAVEDLDKAVHQLRMHGVLLPWGVESGPSGRWVMFHDPGGNLVELVQYNG